MDTKDVVGIMKGFVDPIIDSPDKLEVSVVISNSTVAVSLIPTKEDTGKIIGRQGRNIDAIRTLFSAAMAKNKIKSHVEVVED